VEVIRLQKRPHVCFYEPCSLLGFLAHENIFLDLTKYGSHVYVLVRRGELRASKIMAKRLQNNPKIVKNHILFSYAGGLTFSK